MSALRKRLEAADAERQYSISQLAQELSITPRAIRYYESAQLIAPRRIGTMRVYGHDDRVRLQRILRGKRLGFTLAEIKDWLSLYEVGEGHVRELKALLEGNRRRIQTLERQHRDLSTTLDELRDLERSVREQLAGKGVELPPPTTEG